MMRIERVSMLTGKQHSREIDCTQEQIDEYYLGLKNIKDVFPDLSAEDREFIKTGITQEEWGAVFEVEEEDPDLLGT